MSKEKELQLIVRDEDMDMHSNGLSYVEILGLLDLARIRVERNIHLHWDSEDEKHL